MSEAVYGPILTAACALLFGWVLVAGLKTGTMEFNALFSARRSDQPIRFWLLTAFVAVLTAASATATIGQMLMPANQN